MAELPTEELRWASETVQEVVNINGVPILVENKTEPPDAFKSTGILARQRVGRSRINWFFDLTSRYINHLVERYSVGDVHVTTVNESDVDISERLGGTWEQYGSQTINTVPTYYYRKTA